MTSKFLKDFPQRLKKP